MRIDAKAIQTEPLGVTRWLIWSVPENFCP